MSNRKVLSVILIVLLIISGCNIDQTKVEIADADINVYEFNSDNIVEYKHDKRKMLSDVYRSIDDMYMDADIVVEGIVEDVGYSVANDDYIVYETLFVKVTKSYKGAVDTDIILPILGIKSYESASLEYKVLGDFALVENIYHDGEDELIVEGQEYLLPIADYSEISYK